MCKLIQQFLDLSEPPAWRDLAQALIGTVALFAVPTLVILYAVALGADK
jgi:hypothetical protein